MLETHRLAKEYRSRGGSALVVKDFTLRVGLGEFVSIIGHSGCGKSTVLSMVAGLTKPSGGGIIAGGREVTEAGPDRGVVFQAPCLLPWLTVLDNVLLGVNEAYHTASRQERRQLAEYYLATVGLQDSLGTYPAELSQGMQQRVGIARAFALQPRVLLLDEPFGMLDAFTRQELQDVLLEVWKNFRITALMVTHDVDEAIYLSDRVVMMTDGPEAEIGEIVRVPFSRPRERTQIVGSSEYLALREHLLGFLNERSSFRPSRDPSYVPSAEHLLALEPGPCLTAAA